MKIVDVGKKLIGDFFGCVPAIQALSNIEEVEVLCDPSMLDLINLADLKRHPGNKPADFTINCTDACRYADRNGNLYMSQAFFHQVGLETPTTPPKANLSTSNVEPAISDYFIAPFARSLPNNQRLPFREWQRLIDLMPDKKFVVLGSYTDPRDLIKGENVKGMFGHSLIEVASVLKATNKPLISVITGISHLAFHLSITNVLLDGQSPWGWGVNPEAIKIKTKNVSAMKAEHIINRLW